MTEQAPSGNRYKRAAGGKFANAKGKNRTRRTKFGLSGPSWLASKNRAELATIVVELEDRRAVLRLRLGKPDPDALKDKIPPKVVSMTARKRKGQAARAKKLRAALIDLSTKQPTWREWPRTKLVSFLNETARLGLTASQSYGSPYREIIEDDACAFAKPSAYNSLEERSRRLQRHNQGRLRAIIRALECEIRDLEAEEAADALAWARENLAHGAQPTDEEDECISVTLRMSRAVTTSSSSRSTAYVRALTNIASKVRSSSLRGVAN